MRCPNSMDKTKNEPRPYQKKILVLTSTFPRWKNDSEPPFVFELSKRLGEKFKIYVLAPHFSGAKKYEVIDGLKIYRFQYFWPAKLQKLCYKGGILPNLKFNKLLIFQVPFLLVTELLATIRLVRKIRPVIIHAHWIIPQGLIAGLIKKIFKITYIVTTHGGDIFDLQSKVATQLKKFTLNNTKLTTVVSKTIKQEVLKTINSELKVKVISMGVDSILFHPNKYDQSIKRKYNLQEYFLLFVGFLVEKKGIGYLIKAMPTIIKKFPKSKLLIIGIGPQEDRLKELAKNLKLEKNIIFLGSLKNSELPKYYATADLLIAPSIRAQKGDLEGLPVVIMEGMATGKPIIATRCGGIPEIVKDGQNGFLVNQKSFRQLADKIVYLLSRPGLIKKMGEKSLSVAQKYDWQIISQQYIDLINAI